MTLLLTAPPPPLLLPARIPARLRLDTVECADVLAFLRGLPDACVDLLITDPPFHTTEFTWDYFDEFSAFFEQVWRVSKLDSACLIFANMATALRVAAATDTFKYDWVWCKDAPVGRLHCHYAPMRQHELILVFSKASATSNQFAPIKMRYFPQDLKPFGKWVDGTRRTETATGHLRSLKPFYQEFTGYPRSLLTYDIPRERFHPTQKPVDLVEYLIKTYSRPGDVVCDPFCGSGTTAIAARNTGRHFICGDLLEKYVAIARERLAQPYTPPLPFADPPPPRATQPALPMASGLDTAGTSSTMPSDGG